MFHPIKKTSSDLLSKGVTVQEVTMTSSVKSCAAACLQSTFLFDLTSLASVSSTSLDLSPAEMVRLVKNISLRLQPFRVTREFFFSAEEKSKLPI